MASQTLQLTADQNQSFTSVLSVDGKNITLGFTIRWNRIAGYWVITIKDKDGNLILDSIPLFVAIDASGNMLGQFAYLGIGSAYLVRKSDSSSEYPNSDNLSTEYLLVWGDTVI